MAIFDKAHGGFRVFIGDLGSKVGKYELEKELDYYGNIIDVWVARSPPGFAFVVYKHPEDAEKAVRDLHGRAVCGRLVRVKHAVPYGKQQQGMTLDTYSNLCGRRVRAEHALPFDSRRQNRGPPPRYVSRYRESISSRSRSRDRYQRRSRSRDKSRRSRRSYSRSRSRSKSRDERRSRSSKSNSHDKSRASKKRTDSERSGSPATKSKTRSKSRENGDKRSSESPSKENGKDNGDSDEKDSRGPSTNGNDKPNGHHSDTE